VGIFNVRRNNTVRLLIRKRTLMLCLIPAMLVAATAGCNKGEPRGDVAGEVQFDGRPVETGMVSFEPTQAAIAPRNVPIENGKYRVDGKGALTPGDYRVRITAADRSKMDSKKASNPNAQDEFIPLLPSPWNTQSRLTVNVKPGKNTFLFRGEKGGEPSVETTAD
jgi:hypothetical protein